MGRENWEPCSSTDIIPTIPIKTPVCIGNHMAKLHAVYMINVKIVSVGGVGLVACLVIGFNPPVF